MQKYLNLKLSCLTILSALSLSACNSGSAQHNNTQNSKPQLNANSLVDPTILLDIATLSGGTTGIPRVSEGGSSCINEDKMVFSTYPVERSQNIKILTETSSQFSSLNLDANLDISYALFNLALASSYGEEKVSSAKDIVVIYTEDVSMPVVANGKKGTKEVFHGHEILSDDILNNPEYFNQKTKTLENTSDFLSLCGNGYVSRITVGNRITGKLVLSFGSESEATKFNLGLNTSYGSFVNLRAALDTAKKTTKSKISIDVDIMSSGGSRFNISNLAQSCKNDDKLDDCLSGFLNGMNFMSEQESMNLDKAKGADMSYEEMKAKIVSHFKVLPSSPTGTAMEFNGYPTLDSTTLKFSKNDLNNQSTIESTVKRIEKLQNTLDSIIRRDQDITITKTDNTEELVTKGTYLNDNRNFKTYSTDFIGRDGTNLRMLVQNCYNINTTKCKNSLDGRASAIKGIEQLFNKYSRYTTNNNSDHYMQPYYLKDLNDNYLFYLDPIYESSGRTEFKSVLLNKIFPLYYKTNFYLRANIKSDKKDIQNKINDITGFILNEKDKTLTIQYNGGEIKKRGCSGFESSAEYITCADMENLFFGKLEKTDDNMDKAKEDNGGYYPINSSTDHYSQNQNVSSSFLLEGMEWSAYPNGYLTIESSAIEFNGINMATFTKPIMHPMLFVSTEQRNIGGNDYQLGHVYVQSRDVYNAEKGNLTSAQHLATIAIRYPHYDDLANPIWSFRLHNGNLVFIDSGSGYHNFFNALPDSWDKHVYDELIKYPNYTMKLTWEDMVKTESSVNVIRRENSVAKDFIIYGNMSTTELDQKINDTVVSRDAFDYWKNNMNITINMDHSKYKLEGYQWLDENSVVVRLKNPVGGTSHSRTLYRGGIYQYAGDKIKMTNWKEWEENKGSINPYNVINVYNTVKIGNDKHIECPTNKTELLSYIYDNMAEDRQEMRDEISTNLTCETKDGHAIYFLPVKTVMPITLLLNLWGYQRVETHWNNVANHAIVPYVR